MRMVRSSLVVLILVVLILVVLILVALAPRAVAGIMDKMLQGLPAGGATLFIDKTGRVVVEGVTATSDFSEGLAAAVKGTQHGYIDKEGKLVISNPAFDEVYPFSNGLGRVRSGGKWGFIDKSGKWVVEPKFDSARDFTGEMATIAIARDFVDSNREKLGWGYIDTAGRIVVQPELYEASYFSEGLAMVRRHGGQVKIEIDSMGGWKMYRMEDLAEFIDKTGATVIPPRFGKAMPFNEGLALVQFIGMKSAYIDKNGHVVIDLKNWAADPFAGLSVAAASFREGLAFVDTSSGFVHVPKWGYINKEGNVVAVLDANSGTPFSEGLAVIGKGKLRFSYGYIDKTCKVVIPIQYKAAGDFREGLAPVRIGDKWGFIDRAGKIVIEPKFATAEPFHEGLARVTLK